MLMQPERSACPGGQSSSQSAQDAAAEAEAAAADPDAPAAQTTLPHGPPSIRASSRTRSVFTRGRTSGRLRPNPPFRKPAPLASPSARPIRGGGVPNANASETRFVGRG
jgi:hypothetical protein